MTTTSRILVALAAIGLSTLAPAHAQERLGSAEPVPTYRAGWTFTPTVGFAEIYDDNISLFGVNTAEGQNDDYIASVFPSADLHYSGKHTRFGGAYTGSFLNYRTFSVLNRWDQRAEADLRRQETARLSWFARAHAAMLPTTDAIELGGIPFRHTGATTIDGRGGFNYLLGNRDSLSSSMNYQRVDFDRPIDLTGSLRGGAVVESMSAWRHKLSSRLSTGADYSFRRARVTGDLETFNIHTAEGAIDYDLSPSWSFSGAAGIVYLAPTSTTVASSDPAYRAALNWHRGLTTFHIGYLHSFIPSFGFGGTVKNDEFGVGFHTPLFGSRRFYTDQSVVYRDNEPLTSITEQLPLRSLRTYSIIGWTPQPWVRIEGFYARVQQTSRQVGGELFRNRVGFQIVTSKPMRVQ
jgi:hypothetical protein